AAPRRDCSEGRKCSPRRSAPRNPTDELSNVEQPQRPRELRIRRGNGLDAFAALRMHERQPLRMQQHAVDAEHAERAVVAAIAVAGVADQMMREVLEVAPDLAKAPGLRLRTQQRVTRGVEARR